jgi:hypothetical protein
MSYLLAWLKRIKEINAIESAMRGEFDDQRSSISLPDPIKEEKRRGFLGIWGSREIHRKYEPSSFSYRPRKVKKYRRDEF